MPPSKKTWKTHEFEIKRGLKKILKRLKKNNRIDYQAVMKKIQDIVETEDIYHYKNLRHSMKDGKRVQLGHFVLVFKFVEAEDLSEL